MYNENVILEKNQIKDIKFIFQEIKKRDLAEQANILHPFNFNALFSYILFGIAEKFYKIKTYTYIIKLPNKKEKIGIIQIHHDMFNNRAELSMWLTKDYRKQGFMSQTLLKVHNFAFGELKIRKLYSIIFDDNVSSIKLHEKHNYQKEGFLKQSSICKGNGKIKNEFIYSLLKDEWKNSQI